MSWTEKIWAIGRPQKTRPDPAPGFPRQTRGSSERGGQSRQASVDQQVAADELEETVAGDHPLGAAAFPIQAELNRMTRPSWRSPRRRPMTSAARISAEAEIGARVRRGCPISRSPAAGGEELAEGLLVGQPAGWVLALDLAVEAGDPAEGVVPVARAPRRGPDRRALRGRTSGGMWSPGRGGSGRCCWRPGGRARHTTASTSASVSSEGCGRPVARNRSLSSATYWCRVFGLG